MDPKDQIFGKKSISWELKPTSIQEQMVHYSIPTQGSSGAIKAFIFTR